MQNIKLIQCPGTWNTHNIRASKSCRLANEASTLMQLTIDEVRSFLFLCVCVCVYCSYACHAFKPNVCVKICFRCISFRVTIYLRCRRRGRYSSALPSISKIFRYFIIIICEYVRHNLVKSLAFRIMNNRREAKKTKIPEETYSCCDRKTISSFDSIRSKSWSVHKKRQKKMKPENRFLKFLFSVLFVSYLITKCVLCVLFRSVWMYRKLGCVLHRILCS